MNYTRRDFTKAALAAVPAASTLSLPSAAFAAPNSRISGVQIGAITYSFKQDVRKPAEIIPDLVKIGLSSVELMSNDGELMEGEEGQRKQRDWRAKTSAATHQRVRKMFDDAGINLDILCY